MIFQRHSQSQRLKTYYKYKAYAIDTVVQMKTIHVGIWGLLNDLIVNSPL